MAGPRLASPGAGGASHSGLLSPPPSVPRKRTNASALGEDGEDAASGEGGRAAKRFARLRLSPRKAGPPVKRDGSMLLSPPLTGEERVDVDGNRKGPREAGGRGSSPTPQEDLDYVDEAEADEEEDLELDEEDEDAEGEVVAEEGEDVMEERVVNLPFEPHRLFAADGREDIIVGGPTPLASAARIPGAPVGASNQPFLSRLVDTSTTSTTIFPTRRRLHASSSRPPRGPIEDPGLNPFLSSTSKRRSSFSFGPDEEGAAPTDVNVSPPHSPVLPSSATPRQNVKARAPSAATAAEGDARPRRKLLPSVPERDSPHNPFLEDGPSDLAKGRRRGVHGEREKATAERIEGKVAYVFRGKRVWYDDPDLYPSSSSSRSASPASDEDFARDLKPKRLFAPSPASASASARDT